MKFFALVQKLPTIQDRTARKICFFTLLLLLSSLARAELNCPQTLHENRAPDVSAGSADDTIHISADSSRSQPITSKPDQRLLIFSGHATAAGHRQSIESDTLTYLSNENIISATGGLSYTSPDLLIRGQQGSFDLASHLGQIQQGIYAFRTQPGRGDARQARMTGPRISVLEDASYTTCPPGNEDWLLRFSSVTLDHNEGVGSAQHVRLSFMGLPFLYTPYMSFPIDDRRKSGLLTPSYRLSSEGGGELTIPYYINLAANYDLTLKPRNLTRRGLLIGSEFRYLLTHGQGTINLEYLPNDRVFGNDRGQVNWQHFGQLTSRLQARIDYKQISDDQYLEELGNNLNTTSITHLPQQAELLYSTKGWLAKLRIQSFQTIDASIPKASRPYQVLPALSLVSHLPLKENHINWTLQGEYSNFQRTDRISGLRLDLQPSVFLPLRSNAFSLDSKLVAHYTRYSLNDLNIGAAEPSRTLPQLSIDGQMFLERSFQWNSQALKQTLEPRLFYLYTPYRDQSELPIFDAGEVDLNFSQLFRNNRFNGRDRVGDANQLTVAVTSRLQEADSAREWARLELGQIIYFDDRRVTLPGQAVATASTSAITANAVFHVPGQITVNSDARWEPRINKFDKGAIRLQYAPHERQIINLSYRYRLETLGQTDISFLWPLSQQWHVLGRWNRSLRNNQDLETLAGFEYDNCCWKLQLLHRRYVNDINSTANKTWFIQLTLKGLTSLGNKVLPVLEHGILGYRR